MISFKGCTAIPEIVYSGHRLMGSRIMLSSGLSLDRFCKSRFLKLASLIKKESLENVIICLMLSVMTGLMDPK